MTRQWIVSALVPALMAGCASVSAQYATRPPDDRSATEVAQDKQACEQYTRRRPVHLSYRACMIARSYAASMDMDELGFALGVAATGPHTPGEVRRDMVECDRQAHEVKTAAAAPPPLTAEEERIIADQASPRAGEAYRQHPNAVRMLVSCLKEQGYKIVPWRPLQSGETSTRASKAD